MATLSVLATEYLNYKVVAKRAGVVVDPTVDSVQFAFTRNDDSPSNWVTGSWDTYPDGSTVAKILIGPANSGVALAVGQWIPWIRVTDSPEVPIVELPTLTITT